MIRSPKRRGGGRCGTLWSGRSCFCSGRRSPAAAPPAGPERNFDRARPVRPRGGARPADQPGRALDRLCPPLRRHHDRPLPPLDLADRHRERRSRCRSPPRRQPAALVARRRAASPTSPPAEGGRAQLFVRWMASGQAVADHRPARFAVEHRLVARRPPDRLCDVRARRRRCGSARRRPRPEGAQWAPPLAGDHRASPTAPTARAICSPATSHIFLVSVGRRRAAPAHLRRPTTMAARSRWTPGRPHAPVQRQPLAQLGARGLQHRNLRARRGLATRITRADQPQRARTTSRRCRPTAG